MPVQNWSERQQSYDSIVHKDLEESIGWLYTHAYI